LVRQMEQGLLAPTPIWSNLKTFPAREFYGKIHGITGGYPCQPFSAAGLRKGADDPRHLWPFIKNIVKKSRPSWCFFENVEGHVSLGFESVQKELRQLGYQVEAGIFTAAEAGATHKRSRLFILGLENSVLLRMRGWNDEQRENWRREIQTQGSGELDHSNGIRYKSEYEISAGRDSAELDGEAMADASKSGVSQSGQGGIGEFSEKNRQGIYDRFKQPSTYGREGMADCVSQILEVGGIESARQKFQTTQRSSDWPSRPGEPQHEWEAPRLESSLGYAINGYNFREDLLRMAGNAVVEQTAELAFRTLIQKFL
jgi:DNA (cytosine-5)-methyltransferase 1